MNLWSGAFLQFAISLAVLAPLALAYEDARVDWTWQLAAAVAFLVIFASIFAVVLEYLMFDEVPSALTFAGIAVTCAGVGLLSGGRLADRKR